ncbi:85 kDa calcium-independent phospholipase A2 [Trichuris trichiura]|uniref:85 kDa calcium-independent phospholipase A2 n=1 Tax=Trichuris trichiura TaxID=36087 RepID=A0A077ZIF3_TRITR|nr:85 kDa calcium-independent phospholipase A2 [Trichuris trichiura]
MEKQDRQFNNLIAFDGGGMAGVVLVQTLLIIEKYCGPDWFRCFDWIAGTSFGAVLAILLCQGHSLRGIQKLVFRLKDEIFLFKDAEAAGNALKETLIRELGDGSMASISEPRLVITTCDATARPAKLKLFRNYRPPLSEEECELLGYEHPNELSLWRAAVCSTAVPGRFAPIDQKFIDGGLISNNPTQDLMTEFFLLITLNFQHSEQEENIGCVVSVGTGISPRQISCAPRFNAALTLTGIFVTTTDDYVLDRCRAWCDSQNAPFFRFSPKLSFPLPLDTTDELSLVDACWDTIEYFRRKPDDMELLARLLRHPASMTRFIAGNLHMQTTTVKTYSTCTYN